MSPTSIPADSPKLDEQWLGELRARMVEIAARRAPAAHVDDLVQDAMTVVVDKGPAEAARAGTAAPPLRWCFQVLRNVLGNWYQKRRDEVDLGAVEGTLVDDRPDPLVALTSSERSRMVREAVEVLRARSADCARWLWALACGDKAGDLATEAGVEVSAFYRRLYRCRQSLATILREKGVAP